MSKGQGRFLPEAHSSKPDPFFSGQALQDNGRARTAF